MVNIQNGTELPGGEPIIPTSGLLIRLTLNPEGGGSIPATGHDVMVQETAAFKQASPVCTSPADLALFLQLMCRNAADKA
jgi:hypothetical protein